MLPSSARPADPPPEELLSPEELQEIAEADADFEAGRILSHEEMKDWLRDRSARIMAAAREP